MCGMMRSSGIVTAGPCGSCATRIPARGRVSGAARSGTQRERRAVSAIVEWDDNIPEFEVLVAAANEARERETRALVSKREAAIEALPPEDFFAPREPRAAGSPPSR